MQKWCIRGTSFMIMAISCTQGRGSLRQYLLSSHHVVQKLYRSCPKVSSKLYQNCLKVVPNLSFPKLSQSRLQLVPSGLQVVPRRCRSGAKWLQFMLPFGQCHEICWVSSCNIAEVQWLECLDIFMLLLGTGVVWKRSALDQENFGMATRTPTGANEGRLQKKSNGHFPGQNSLKICVQTPKHLPHLD